MTFLSYFGAYIKWWLLLAVGFALLQLLLRIKLDVGYVIAMFGFLWQAYAGLRRAELMRHFPAIAAIHLVLTVAGFFGLGLVISLMK